MKGMILAAGLGTRLKPFTDKHPKALAPVNGKPLLLRNMEYLASFGVNDLIVNVHHFADQIEDFLRDHTPSGIRVQISDERDAVLETGGGLKKAAHFFNDGQTFVLMNVDILTRLDLHAMLSWHRAQQATVTLAVSQRESSRCFLWDTENRLCGWRNRQSGEERITRPSAESLTEKSFSGIHLIEPAFLQHLGEGSRFSIVDTYLEAAASERIMGYDHTGVEVLDVGKPESVLRAEQLFL